MRATAFACLLLLAAVSCRTSGLAFRADERVEVVAPKDNSTVRLPVTIRWQVKGGFTVKPAGGSVSDDAGYFAVFVDSSPIPPGESLGYVARDDKACVRSQGCPDERYLNDRNIYPTTETNLTLPGLRDNRPQGRQSAKDRHEVTVVLLNGRGERIGESAFEVAFFVDRSA